MQGIENAFRGNGEFMKLKCAIFDFDGTLFDSMPIWDDVPALFLKLHGKEPKPTTREDVRPLSIYQSACFMKAEFALDISVEEIMGQMADVVRDFYLKKVLPKPFAEDLLKRFISENVGICVATASGRLLIEGALKRCGLDQYFDAIFTCDEIGHGKDEPVIYRLAMEHFGASRDDTIVFEDALHAAKTAKADGFIVAGVYDESEKSKEELIELADYYFDDLKQAVEYRF